MAITGKLSNVTTFKEDGILGGGRINFEVIMAGGGYDSAEEPVVPALWIEEVSKGHNLIKCVTNFV